MTTIEPEPWPFKSPEGFFGWRFRSREGWLFELIFLQPPYIGSDLLLGPDERPN